jgi:prepilin-type N-terminal cleavage/methylation domain-containing protein
MRHHSRCEQGFTLIELVICVAIIGVLAATAIPAFAKYQFRSKRSEAYTNLEGVRKVEIAYFSEFGNFVLATPSPFILLSADKQNWLEALGRFSSALPGQGFEQLGWQPEGATYFDYDVNIAATGSSPAFTAAAYGDVDGDGFVSLFLYAYPDPSGVAPPCYQCPGGPGAGGVTYVGPPQDAFGNDVYNSVAPVLPPGGDDF